MSALVTPFLLCFSIRYKALDIVDFFRNFTVEVVGVGDVCSFAQMDVRKHGNPEVSLHLKPSFNSPVSLLKPLSTVTCHVCNVDFGRELEIIMKLEVESLIPSLQLQHC